MDVSIRLPEGAELRLEGSCRACSAGWLHHAAVTRDVTVVEAVTLAEPGDVTLVLEHTEDVLLHLGACRDDAEQEPEHGGAVALAARLDAAELRLGVELVRAQALLRQRTAA